MRELGEELLEQRDTITDAQMWDVLAIMSKTLHKQTSRGGDSMSTAMNCAIGKIPEYVLQAQGKARATAPPPPRCTCEARAVLAWRLSARL